MGPGGRRTTVGRLIWARIQHGGNPRFSWIRDKDTSLIYVSACGRLEMDSGDKIWLECQCDPGRGISQLPKAAIRAT
jgi:hypothetical protein